MNKFVTPSPGPAATLLLSERTSAGPGAPEPTALSSATLLRGHSAVRIEHNGAFYLLRNTRLGKLILTK